MTGPRILLASGSAIRASLLRGAGVVFDIVRPEVDEDALKQAARKEGLDLEMTAMRLAEEKCLAVAGQDAFVIGADQILEFEGRAYDKPKNMGEARARLLDMAGAPHTLINAVAVARHGEIVWRNLDRPTLRLRALTADEVDAYLDAAGPEVLKSVGAYQIEQLGSRLFERIEGDHFAVLGLSLLPLLAFLRREGVMEF